MGEGLSSFAERQVALLIVDSTSDSLVYCPATPNEHYLWGSGPLALKGDYCVAIAGAVYLRSVTHLPWPLSVRLCMCACVRVFLCVHASVSGGAYTCKM